LKFTAVPSRQIVLTGVSRGLGRALATRLIELGHTVQGCARSAGEIAELQTHWPTPHSFEVVDVVHDEQVAAWARKCLAAGAVPDILINNAAVIHPNRPLWKLSEREFGDVIDVNLKGVANVIRHWLPPMLARGRGVVVNFSSGWGRSTSPEVAAYCASKWGIEGLTKALADELPHGLAAVPLNPGIIDTDMLRSCFGDAAGDYSDTKSWALGAAPFILGLGPADNGQSLTVPN
jgi:NAD(P)-dependent dehydrogenase (short-subunit alcohol dehydrogenase family)